MTKLLAILLLSVLCFQSLAQQGGADNVANQITPRPSSTSDTRIDNTAAIDPLANPDGSIANFDVNANGQAIDNTDNNGSSSSSNNNNNNNNNGSNNNNSSANNSNNNNDSASTNNSNNTTPLVDTTPVNLEVTFAESEVQANDSLVDYVDNFGNYVVGEVAAFNGTESELDEFLDELASDYDTEDVDLQVDFDNDGNVVTVVATLLGDPEDDATPVNDNAPADDSTIVVSAPVNNTIVILPVSVDINTVVLPVPVDGTVITFSAPVNATVVVVPVSVSVDNITNVVTPTSVDNDNVIISIPVNNTIVIVPVLVDNSTVVLPVPADDSTITVSAPINVTVAIVPVSVSVDNTTVVVVPVSVDNSTTVVTPAPVDTTPVSFEVNFNETEVPANSSLVDYVDNFGEYVVGEVAAFDGTESQLDEFLDELASDYSNEDVNLQVNFNDADNIVTVTATPLVTLLSNITLVNDTTSVDSSLLNTTSIPVIIITLPNTPVTTVPVTPVKVTGTKGRGGSRGPAGPAGPVGPVTVTGPRGSVASVSNSGENSDDC